MKHHSHKIAYPLIWQTGCIVLILLISVASSYTTTAITPTPSGIVDASTLDHKLLMGYQGWFGCPGDGSKVNGWVHWFKDMDHATTDNLSFDLWPDTSELGKDEQCPTPFTKPDGSPAPLYSAYNPVTVARHFQWMKTYGIDGVFVQRFSSELGDPRFFDMRNRVLQNARLGAEASGRVFAVMYDISGQNPSTLVDDLKRDWSYLVDDLKITQSSRYLHHNGKPVLAIWGFGFTDRTFTPQQALDLINYFKSDAARPYQTTLMGGVPTYWRTLDHDSMPDKAWSDVYRAFDVLSPWAVGRYGDASGADNYKHEQIALDLAVLKTTRIAYMPVVFPGFSWKHLNNGTLNQIPRQCGHFYWRQVYNALSAGATMIYGAMFDEVDEGTAMYKIAPTKADMPTQATFVSLDIDGCKLPSDWYLRLAGEATKMLRGEIPLSSTIPIKP